MWRSLDEYEQSPEFLAAVEEEFPEARSLWSDVSSRRAFLRRMGASFALAGLAGCVRPPQEKIVPAVETPEHGGPGTSREFATSMPVPGGALGLLVRSRDGRPLKAEGNPRHPASLGATDVFAQASLLDLYDPDRSQVVRQAGSISNWPAFTAALASRAELHSAREGAGLHVVSGNVTSPTLLSQLGQLLEAFPNARWYECEQFSADNVRPGTQLAFGRELSPRYSVEKADVILALDADFLNEGPAKLRLAREFARRRRIPPSGRGTMNRLYVAESTTTLTGAAADHRLPVSPDEIAPLLAGLAARLGIDVDGYHEGAGPAAEEWLAAVVGDLQAAGRRGLVIVGPSQPPEVHALAHAVNAKLQSIGQTVRFIEPIDRPAGHSPRSMADLAQAIDDGDVETLIVLDANVMATAPGDLDFAALVEKVPFAAHLGLYRDETAGLCRWHVPALHFLESWSDARAEDGTAGIVQPLIAPLYNGKSPHDLLNVLLEKPDRSAHETVQEFWRQDSGEGGFARRWKQSLHDGVIAGTAAQDVNVSLRREYQPSIPESHATANDRLYVAFRPDPTVRDGRYANNGWLQELPKPFTKLTWENAALVSPATAEKRGLSDGDVVTLAANDRTIAVPVLAVPGQPDEVATLHTGYGRSHAGRNGDGRGVDVTPLQSSASPWTGAATLERTGQRVDLPTTQHHHLMENRDLVRGGTLQEFQKSPAHPPFMAVEGHHDDQPASLYPEDIGTGQSGDERPQWGMTIDLGACTGCNACVTACQAENNIPIVGPEEVRRGREMHWIRVDTYYSGEPARARAHHQPVACMHCEHAPCEPVCPVAATTHSDEGLNEMTYNRCIGTRYCSNNCPYKVRRFNFLDYRTDVKETPVLQLLQNPEVSVRSRGVMEKCTYCVQRISAARIQAKMAGREIADGEVVTACQAACPSEAIVFGDVADPSSAVAKQKAHPLNYGLLTELNTRPRTTYLAAVGNPHPDLQRSNGATAGKTKRRDRRDLAGPSAATKR